MLQTAGIGAEGWALTRWTAFPIRRGRVPLRGAAWVAAAAMASHMLRRATGSIPAEGSSRNAATPEGGIHGHRGGGVQSRPGVALV